MAIGKQRAQDRRHTACLFLEVTFVMIVSSVIAYAISQTMSQTYSGIVSKADRLEEQRGSEELAQWRDPSQADENGRSPLYIDHLTAQDQSWVAPAEEAPAAEPEPEPVAEPEPEPEPAPEEGGDEGDGDEGTDESSDDGEGDWEGYEGDYAE